MAQWVTCFLHKRKDLSSALQNPHKNQAWLCVPVSLALGRQTQESPWSSGQPASPSQQAPGSVQDLSQKNNMESQRFCSGWEENVPRLYFHYQGTIWGSLEDSKRSGASTSIPRPLNKQGCANGLGVVVTWENTGIRQIEKCYCFSVLWLPHVHTCLYT